MTRRRADKGYFQVEGDQTEADQSIVQHHREMADVEEEFGFEIDEQDFLGFGDEENEGDSDEEVAPETTAPQHTPQTTDDLGGRPERHCQLLIKCRGKNALHYLCRWMATKAGR